MPRSTKHDPAPVAAAQAAYDVLREGCAPFAAGRADRPERLELAVRSLVHGLAARGFAEATDASAPFGLWPSFESQLALLVP